ncbi:aldehyde dehydrogenase [Ramicandelaber brevisporus]|nr:aldehyde dehydrogenase [Ramicandelaber brevisporus]
MSTSTAAAAAVDSAESYYTPLSDISTTVDSLHKTFASGRTRPLAYRAKLLSALLDGLKDLESELANAIHADMRRAPAHNLAFEIWVAQKECQEYLDKLEQWAAPESVRSESVAFIQDTLEIRKEPQGVVLIAGPWNYPVRLLVLPLIGAIAAGNCVVVKPSEIAVHSMRAITKLVDGYLDPSVVRVVNGAVEQSTELLKYHFDHIFYTGAGSIGKIYMAAGARNLCPVTLELGGKSPAIIDSNLVDMKRAAERIVWGKFINTSQTCVAVDYILVMRSVYPRFVQLLGNAIKGAFGADPKQSADYGRIISKRHFLRLRNVLERSVATGKVNLVGSYGQKVMLDDLDEDDLYIPPTIVSGAPKDDPLMEDEIFGPILPVIVVDSIQEAVDYINTKDNPLAMYIFTANTGTTAKYILDNTRSGGAVVNDTAMHMAAPELPFGGCGASGIGAYHGKHTFETFVHRRSVLTRQATGPYKLDALRFMPLTGPENAWKLDAIKTLLYAPPHSQMTGVQRAVRMVPGVSTALTLIYVLRLLIGI